ncbi:MAG: Ig-like domain-containing protein [Clostridia bacterium]|nr:Ig-like domain-containing protein [Clostridia bacterium]MBQ6960962.1 Ig-like domain-containing protein [Clostridia bacterium]
MKRRITAALCCVLLLAVCGVALADQDFTFAAKEYSIFEGETLELELLRQGDALGGDVTWKSASQKTATVSPDGLVTGQGKGDTVITAASKVNGKSYTAKAIIHVLRAVTQVTVDEKALTVLAPDDPLLAGRLAYEFEDPQEGETMPVLLLYVNQETEIKTSALPKDASNRRCILTAADESLVQARANVLTAKAVGETILTVASQSNPEVAVRYHVYCVKRTRSIAISFDKKAVGVGGTALAAAVFTPDDTTIQDVVWSTTTPRIISISETGVITGLAKGVGQVRAKAADGSGKFAEATINVQQMPESIALTSKNSSLFVGGSILVTAKVQPGTANNKKVVWTSSDPAVATVNSEGRVTGKGRGTVVITCTADADPAVTAEMVLTVGQQVTAIKADPKNVTVPVGRQLLLNWTVQPANANNQNVTFTSSAPRIAAVDAYGIVEGLARGEATITIKATDGSNRTATVRVTVTQLPESVSIKQSSVAVYTGRSIQLTSTVLPANTNNKRVTWSVADPSIATVNKEGRVTGVKAGTTTVICASEEEPSLTAACQVIVNQHVTGITVSPAQLNLRVGESARISWLVSPEDATDKTVSFTSGNTRIATVDPDGTIHALKRGDANITVKANDGSGKTARVKVSVIQPVTGVHMGRQEYVLDPDESLTITAVLEPSDASNTNMSWVSTDERIATVKGKTNKPRVYGHAWGETYMIGTTEDGGFVTSCRVRVGTYRKALTITDFYLDGNAPKISIRNNSNMNMARIYFMIELYDDYDNPIICTTENSHIFTGYYIDTLGEGRTTRHGRFHFDNYVQPGTKIGYMVFTLTGYRTDEGFRYTYQGDDILRMTYMADSYIGPYTEDDYHDDDEQPDEQPDEQVEPSI